MHKGDRNIHGVRWKLQCIKSENVLQFPHPSCRTSFNFCVVFSPYFNMKNLLEIVSIITVFSSSRYIAGHLQKGNAEQFQSLHHGSYLCLPSGHIHVSLPPQPSRRNLFEFLETRDGLHHASYVTIGELGTISSLGKSLSMVSGFMAQPCQGGVLGRGRHSPCSWCYCHIPERPTAHQEPTHSPAPGSCRAEPATSQSIPAAPAAPAVEGNSCWFLEKPKNQNAGVRRVAEELSL